MAEDAIESGTPFNGDYLEVGMVVAVSEIEEQVMTRHVETHKMGFAESDRFEVRHSCFGRRDDLRGSIGIPFTVLAKVYPLIVLRDALGDGGAMDVTHKKFVAVTDEYCKAFKSVERDRRRREDHDHGEPADTQPQIPAQVMQHIQQLQQQLQAVGSRLGKLTDLNDSLIEELADRRRDKNMRLLDAIKAPGALAARRRGRARARRRAPKRA